MQRGSTGRHAAAPHEDSGRQSAQRHPRERSRNPPGGCRAHPHEGRAATCDAKPGTLTQSTTTREPDSVHHLAPGGGEPETMGGKRTVWSADGCHLPPTISRAQHPPLYLLSLLRQPTKLLNEANSTSRRRLRELALGRVGRTRRSGSRNTRRRALRGPDQTPRHRSSRALNVARILNTAE